MMSQIYLELRERQVEYATETGTLSSNLIAVPSALSWLEHLEPEERTQFYQDLLKAVALGQETDNWQMLIDSLGGWRGKALRRAQPALQERLSQARRALAPDQQHLWSLLRRQIENLYALECQLQEFEERYGLGSEAFYGRALKGEMDDGENLGDITAWMGIYETWLEKQEEYRAFLETHSSSSQTCPS
jgi:hypothetical protein